LALFSSLRITRKCLNGLKTPKSLIVVILEYPLDQAKVADELKSTFLTSLNITNTEQGRGANALPRAAHD